MIFVARLSLRARQRLPAGAVNRLQGQKVLCANLRYRTIQYSGAPSTLAEFPRNLRRELRIRLLDHHL
jgi:hypothetical protein